MHWRYARSNEIVSHNKSILILQTSKSILDLYRKCHYWYVSDYLIWWYITWPAATVLFWIMWHLSIFGCWTHTCDNMFCRNLDDLDISMSREGRLCIMMEMLSTEYGNMSDDPGLQLWVMWYIAMLRLGSWMHTSSGILSVNLGL